MSKTVLHTSRYLNEEQKSFIIQQANSRTIDLKLLKELSDSFMNEFSKELTLITIDRLLRQRKKNPKNRSNGAEKTKTHIPVRRAHHQRAGCVR